MCAQTAKQTVTIKKYANRRLYNTATSSYVTLEDLSAMVKEGCEFNVYDAKSSDDITRSVLTQIIVEEENKTGQQNLLPISFLRQLIGFYGDSLQWMVPKYLEHSMETLSGNQDQIRDYFQTTLGSIFPFGTTLEEMSKQNMSMFENTLRMFSPMSSIETLTSNMTNAAAFNPMTAWASPVGSNTATTDTAAATSTASTTKSEPATTCCATNKKTTADTTAAACCTAAPAETKPTASVTNLKPRNNDANTISAAVTANVSAPAPTATTTTAAAPASTPAATTTTATTTTTPMPNVQSATAANNSGADDMQQKIANLQRQLADLAKSRA